LHQVGDLFELNVKFGCQKVKSLHQYVLHQHNILAVTSDH
jgi:hypothetical protein